MSFPHYPEYKDSGVEWLGEVPAHWCVTRLKFVAHVQTGVAKGKDNEGKDVVEVPYLRVANVQDGYLALSEVATILIPVVDLDRYRLQKGDVLMNEGGDFDKLGRGHVWGGEIEPCIHQNHVFAVRPHGVMSDWLNLLTGSGYAQFYFMGRSKQSTNLASISSTNVMEFPVLVPSPDEQEVISHFLDAETKKIDGLISEQEKLIALLKEKRQAVISNAVTKGLDPSAKMKDSGIEWIGEVPAHWTVSRVGRYASILSGFAFPSSGFTEDESETRLLRGVNVGVSRLKWTEVVYWKRAPDDGLDDFALREGQIVVGMDRPWISEGVRVARVRNDDLPCLLLQRVTALTMRAGLTEAYLFSLLRSQMFVDYFIPDTTGVSVPHISPTQITDFSIPIPPLDEQLAISKFIEIKSAESDLLMNVASKGIELLKERRSALISAAVTGKIDVRKAAAAEAA